MCCVLRRSADLKEEYERAKAGMLRAEEEVQMLNHHRRGLFTLFLSAHFFLQIFTLSLSKHFQLFLHNRSVRHYSLLFNPIPSIFSKSILFNLIILFLRKFWQNRSIFRLLKSVHACSRTRMLSSLISDHYIFDMVYSILD